MIKNHTEFNTAAYKEMVQKSFIGFCSSAVIGIGLIVAFAFIYPATNYNTYNIFILVFGIVLTVAGLAYTFLMSRTYLRVKAANLSIDYEFNEKEIFEVSYRGKEKVEESHIDYDAFHKYKITKNYLFLYLYNKRAVPVKKDDNFEEILKIIKVDTIQKKVI